MALTLPKPNPGYRLQLVSVGDHIRKKRLALGLMQKEVASRLGATSATVKNWEQGHTEIEVRFYPKIIGFLGYNPLPEARTRGEVIRRERMSRGLAANRLAQLAGIDENTVARLEADRAGMARQPIAAVLRILGVHPPTKNGSPRSNM